ncbi:MAG: CYTH domain-containing protein [Flavobacteriaceae bacterium]|nr:CYTH domain-containing protein [Flavobacteriaceae bacterium]
MIEIERKFLVTSEIFKAEAHSSTKIIQGFLSVDPERTVRVRVKGIQGFLTIKGKSNEAGTTRFEWEKKISVAEAEALLKICKKGVIEKIRYEIPVGNHLFEVDVFHGDNEGLIVAEIELSSENEAFTKPSWLGEEVTGEIQYYNSLLSKKPFVTWE